MPNKGQQPRKTAVSAPTNPSGAIAQSIGTSTSNASPHSQLRHNAKLVIKLAQEQLIIIDPPAREVVSSLKMPTICELNAAPWTTLEYVPNDIRDDWSRIVLDCLAKLVASVSIGNLTFLHLETKGLLATVRHWWPSARQHHQPHT